MVQALSGVAEVLLQLGEPDLAYEALTRCIELAPEGPEGTPRMQLAQLCEGLEALAHYAKGLELLIAKRARLCVEVVK